MAVVGKSVSCPFRRCFAFAPLFPLVFLQQMPSDAESKGLWRTDIVWLKHAYAAAQAIQRFIGQGLGIGSIVEPEEMNETLMKLAIAKAGGYRIRVQHAEQRVEVVTVHCYRLTLSSEPVCAGTPSTRNAAQSERSACAASMSSCADRRASTTGNSAVISLR